MKILIVSDIHGNYNNMEKVLKNDPSFDYLFLAGDILSGPNREGYDPEKLAELLNSYKDKIIAVKGNCDYREDLQLLDFKIDELYKTIPMDNKTILMTHGHYFNKDHLPDVRYSILITGHTHVPVLERAHNKINLNPGSISLPRQDSTKSYICYEDGVFALKDLESNKDLEKIYIV